VVAQASLLLVAETALAGKLVAHSVPTANAPVFRKTYEDAVVWPEPAALLGNLATPEEIEGSKKTFMEWLTRVLTQRWIPAGLEERVFGVKSYMAGADTLLVQYQAGGYHLRIKDTSTSLLVHIASRRFLDGEVGPEDRVCSVLSTFLREAGRARDFERIDMSVSKDLMRFDLCYSTDYDPEGNRRLLWWTGNPTIWVQGENVVISIVKRLDGEYPIDLEFGVLQRFPPLEETLMEAPIEDAIACLTEELGSRSADAKARQRIAKITLATRPDRDGVIVALFAAYREASTSDKRIALLRVLRRIIVSSNTKEGKRVVDFLESQLGKEDGSVLGKEINRVLSAVRQSARQRRD